MMSAYAKRRSTRNPVAAAGAISSTAPRSPQFGGDEDGGTGGGIGSSGGGTGEPDDDCRPARQSGVTPFDERVKNVRSRIREMVAVAGEDSSDGSEEFDVNSATSKALARGPKAALSKSSTSGMTPRSDEASSEVGQRPIAERKRSQPTNSGPPSHSEGAAQLEPPPRTIGTSGAGGSSPSSSPRQGPAARASAAAAAARQRSTSPPAETTGSGQLVGRDGAAHQGARVRVVDPRIARYVEPTGTIVEVRCGGERVRVEHDGAEAAQRYYSTGKGGEYQLYFEFAADSLVGAPARRKSGASSAPPVVLDSPAESPAASPAEAPARFSRATARGSAAAAASPLGSPEGSPGAPAPQRTSRATAKPRASRSRAGQRQSTEPPIIAADPQPDIAEPKAATKKSRYSQLREARQSKTGSSDVNAKVAAVESNAEPEGRKIPYSQRRSMRMSQMQASGSDAVAAEASSGAPPDSIVSRGGGALPSSMAASAHGSKHGKESASDEVPASSSCSNSKAQLEPDSEKDSRLENLRQEHEQLLSRLRHLEQTFVRDLGAVKDDVHLQIETTEKRIVTRVLEELDKRIRQTTGMTAGKVTGKWPLDKMSSCQHNEPVPQGVGTPVNEEPEQEYDTCDLSDISQVSGSQRGSEIWRSPPVEDSSPQQPARKPDREVSSAELADNRQRLENINNAARRITQSLGGTPVTNSAPAAPPASAVFDGLQTPDFAAAPSFAGSPATGKAPAEGNDGLDAEMQRLAELRRFASNVLQAAEVQGAQARTSTGHVGAPAQPAWADNRMSHARGPAPQEQLFAERRPSGLRDAANQQDLNISFDGSQLDCYVPPARAPELSGESGQRRRTAAPSERSYQDQRWQPPPPWEDDYRPTTPRGSEIPAQPPPQPPPMQAEGVPGQAWNMGMRNGSAGRVRRSAAQPLRVPWPSAGGTGDWEGNSQSEGRLVF